MGKPRTAIQLIAVLDRELSWRRVDLLFALRLVQRATGNDVNPAIRAAVLLLYAHWEGFIKKAACHYSDFLSAQRLRFSDVNLSLSGLRVHEYVAELSDVKKRIYVSSEVLEQIKSIESERLHIPVSAHITRIGNLSFDTLSQILQFFSLPPDRYTLIKPLVDEALIAHRNKIAHGEYLDVSADRYKDMHREIVAAIEMFKSDIEEAATTKSYRRRA